MPPKPPRIPKLPTSTTPYKPKHQPNLYSCPRTTPPKIVSRRSQPKPTSTTTSRSRLGAHTFVRASITAATVVGFFVFIRDTFISLDTVRGSSMAPTLSPHAHDRGELDRVVIRRGSAAKNVQRGDIITFWKPHKADEISIKRVIGLEGDTVYPQRGFALDSEMRSQGRLGLNDGLGVGVEEGAVVVPKGHVWVEGDNWRKSLDSCDFGPVSKALIDGKATRVWGGVFKGWRGIEDRRDGKGRSRVVEGRGDVSEKLFADS